MIDCCSKKWSLTQWYLKEILWKIVGISMGNLQTKKKKVCGSFCFFYSKNVLQTKGLLSLKQ